MRWVPYLLLNNVTAYGICTTDNMKINTLLNKAFGKAFEFNQKHAFDPRSTNEEYYHENVVRAAGQFKYLLGR